MFRHYTVECSITSLTIFIVLHQNEGRIKKRGYICINIKVRINTNLRQTNLKVATAFWIFLAASASATISITKPLRPVSLYGRRSGSAPNWDNAAHGSCNCIVFLLHFSALGTKTLKTHSNNHKWNLVEKKPSLIESFLIIRKYIFLQLCASTLELWVKYPFSFPN